MTRDELLTRIDNLQTDLGEGAYDHDAVKREQIEARLAELQDMLDERNHQSIRLMYQMMDNSTL